MAMNKSSSTIQTILLNASMLTVTSPLTSSRKSIFMTAY